MRQKEKGSNRKTWSVFDRQALSQHYQSPPGEPGWNSNETQRKRENHVASPLSRTWGKRESRCTQGFETFREQKKSLKKKGGGWSHSRRASRDNGAATRFGVPADCTW